MERSHYPAPRQVASASYNQACKLKPSLSVSGESGQNIIEGHVEILLRGVRERAFEFAESSDIMHSQLCGVLILGMKCSIATSPDSYNVVVKSLYNRFQIGNGRKSVEHREMGGS